MKIVVNPQQKQFSDFVKSIHLQFDKEGTIIYKQRNEIRVFEVGGVLLNVKRFRVPAFFNRIVYTYFRLSKAQRSYQNAVKIKEKGIETPEPVAYIITKRGGLLHYSYYISRQADHNRTMYEFGKGGIEGREHILNKFAEFTSRIHNEGVYHQDYSPGNILFKETDKEVEFCVVDINRMHFGDVSTSRGCSNLARLWGQEPLFRLVAGKYAELRNVEAEDCIKSVLAARGKFWKKFTSKRPLPFASDEAAFDGKNIRLSVILSTYNQPDWLENALWGYEAQTDPRFEVIIADDGSDSETKDIIEQLKTELSFTIKHVWQKNDGFRKCTILNKAILVTSTDYLLFSDGDCIPRCDFVATHLKHRRKGYFLSGGYFKLPMNISEDITREDVISGRCFNLKWLKHKGLVYSFKNNKLASFGFKEKVLNFFTTTKPTWNGHNASGWRSDIMAVNGFDERMQYGGEDRELGERLGNNGIHGKQIRYSAVCVHLDHSRGYVTEEALRKNREIRKATKEGRITKTLYGIEK